MSLILKDPGASLDYAVDWGDHYLGDDILIASQWSVEPNHASGLVVDSHTHDERASSVVVSGGEPGRVYRLTNHVTTASGRIDRRSFHLRTEAR